VKRGGGITLAYAPVKRGGGITPAYAPVIRRGGITLAYAPVKRGGGITLAYAPVKRGGGAVCLMKTNSGCGPAPPVTNTDQENTEGEKKHEITVWKMLAPVSPPVHPICVEVPEPKISQLQVESGFPYSLHLAS
jgi:hypothetical protein